MEIRQVSAAERPDTMFPLQAYAFEATGPLEEMRERYRSRMPYYETSTSLVAYEGGEARACVAAFPMWQNVRGLLKNMAGVASVASHPATRRRGYVRTLLNQLLRQMRDQGCPVSVLYPFRPSFYARFGYVGLPRARRVSFTPESIGRGRVAGEVARLHMRDGFAEWDALSRRLAGERHGFAVYDEARTAEFATDELWVAIARAQGEVVGAVRYRIDRFGGALLGQDLLTTGPLGRALLLQFFAGHVDQVARVEVKVGTDEVPELWGTDMVVTTEGLVRSPANNGPMARILDLPALDGIGAGPGAVTVEVVEDEFIAGVHRLESDAGRLRIATGGTKQATLTAAGLSGLVYGVLDPIEVITRGLGEIDPPAIEPLRSMFPRELPYVFADF